MQTDTVITLANDKEYLLLLKSKLNNENYFLAVLLDSNQEPTSEYAAIKEINKDGKLLAQKINDPLILNQLLADFQDQYDENYGN